MLKEKLLISAKQAENLIYDMTLYGDHTYQQLRKLNKFKIQEFFEMNKYPWKKLVESTRSPKNIIPGVENFAGYEWSLNAKNTTLTVYHNDHPVETLTGSGQVSIFDYHTKFVKSLNERREAIKKGSYAEILSCITHGVAAVESYVTGKANDWNNAGKQPRFETDRVSNLGDKLNSWLFTMTSFQANQAGAAWNYFTDFKNLNNTVLKHNPKGSHAVTYEEMVKILNKFRKGISELLFILHQKFNDPVPSKIIRGIYLPDIFI